MKSTASGATDGRMGLGRPRRLLKGAILSVLLGAIAYGGQVTIFRDDFEDQGVGTNPAVPPIGEPWLISEVVDPGINVGVDPLAPNNNVLWFGAYRNSATAPFSVSDRQLIEQAQNLTVSFDYYGQSSPSGYLPFFDVAGFCGEYGRPKFFVRFDPQGSGGLHDVDYLAPGGGLLDSGLDMLGDSVQSVTIAADFNDATFQLDIDGNSVTLPTFTCPSELAWVSFEHYGVALSSARIDNVRMSVSVAELAGETIETPEPAEIVMLVAAGLVLALAWIMWLRHR